MSNQNSTTTLNEKLLDEFSTKLEKAINDVCQTHALDPRAELLVTLGLFSAQVGIDSGYNKREFLALMGEMYDDFEPEEVPVKKNISQLN